VATVLIPIPSKDFDPTEVAVSWKVLKRLGHSVVFATPAGREGSADDIIQTSPLRVASGSSAQMAVNAYLKTAGRLSARRKWRSMRARLRRNFTIAAEIPDSAGNGVWRWSAAGNMTREAVLLLFDSVDVTVSTFWWISFACAQGRTETE